MRFPFDVCRVILLALLGLSGAGAIQNQLQSVTDPGKLWALVIGISNYTKAEPLQFAASDAQDFSDFLQSPRGGAIPPDHMITLIEDQATRTEVLLALDSIQEKVQNGDSVYIYIAGHGYMRQRAGYFIPSDGDLRSAAASAVPFMQLKTMIESGLAQARNRIVLTDICHAGRIGTAPTALDVKIQNLINEEFQNLQGGKGTFLNLFASRPSEASWERDDLGRGVFTHALLEALSGKAVNPGETIADARRVVSYVQAEVPKYTADRQHPVANQDFDPNLPLAYLDKPGPAPKAGAGQAVLEILSVDKTSFSRFQWIDPQTQSTVVRQLSPNQGPVQIGPLAPGELELSFFDAGNQAHRIKVKLGPGRNTLDLSRTKLNRYPSPEQSLEQLASRMPFLPSSAARPSQARAIPIPVEGRDASLSIRFEAAAQVSVDGIDYGESAGGGVMQLEGLAPGPHLLRLVSSPEREQRYRVKLFAGHQIFDPPSGELRFVADLQAQARETPAPPGLSSGQQELYRRFFAALREEHLVDPAGDSARDYYNQLRATFPPAVRDTLRNRLIVTMGNHAQRTILKYLRGGDTRWKAGAFDNGAILVDHVRQLFKTTPLFESQQSFFQGRAMIERGQYIPALQELQRSVALDPEAGHAYNAIGLAYWKQNLFERAIPPLQQAVALSPQWTYPRNTLALIYLEQRRYDESERMFQGSIAVDKEDSTAFHGLGQLYLLLGRLEDAEAQIRQAIEFNPGNAYAYETLGRLRQIQRRNAEAEQAYRLAIRLEPDEPSFQASLADLLRQLNRSQEAGQVWQRIVDSNLNNFRVVQAYTGFLRDQKRYAEAEAAFDKALKLSPSDANLCVITSDFLRERGRERDAEKQLRRAQQIAPNNAYVHHALALQSLRQKKVADAEKELALAFKADPRLAAPHQLLGDIRFAQKRYSAALDEYRKAAGLTIDANRQQELDEQITAAQGAFIREEIDRAEKLLLGGRKAEAWSIYAAALKSAPGSRELRNAILQFATLAPAQADVSQLPPAVPSDALKTGFWSMQHQAEESWQKGEKDRAFRTFIEAFDQMSVAERRILGSTAFNIGNESTSLHQMVYRWCLRLLGERNYRGALDLVGSAMRQSVFAVIPDYRPLTIDSLMYRADIPDPKTIADYDIAHHPDRRAHEIYAAALAGEGKMDEGRRYLAALEQSRPDLGSRLLIARILQGEARWNEAAAVLREGMTDPKPSEQSALLAEAFVKLAEIQCQAGECTAARDTLQEGLRVLPGNKLIEAALKKLKI